MKKVLALILIVVMLLALGACKPGDDDTPTTPTANGTTEINWSYVPDNDITGAWTPKEPIKDEYVLFTPDGKLRIVYGTIVYESDIMYGVDGQGNKSCYTECNYLYGQWVYNRDGDTLTVKYPDGKEVLFELASYTPITLQAKEQFAKKDELVGKWSNKLYGDSYEFTDDGYVIFTQSFDDGVYVYDVEVKYTYTVEGELINMYYFAANDNNEMTNTFTYTLEGTKLMLGDNDYYLNGEGSPEATEAETIPVE
ncbi:MAG: hypothetical protein IJD19_03680 [Ruminococcus sp.]|nr:hypothetical protein [Ruminococcus sp.]